MLPNEVVPMLYECARTHQLSILTYDGADIITENSQDPVSYTHLEKLDTRVKGIPVVFYNALGFPVTDIVEVSIETSKFCLLYTSIPFT